MQKLFFKKYIDLNHQLKELVSISVDESIHYKMENEGMRALGAIIINGEYKNDLEKYDFQDTIDLDILALYDKIVDKKEFHVKVEDFDYQFVDGNLSLTIQAHIYGVKDDEDRIIEANNDIENDEDVIKEIENLLKEDEAPIELENDRHHDKKIEVVDSDMIDDLDEDIGTYYLYVVGENDNYSNIAEHYCISEEVLKKYNHNRELSLGSIIIIPYVA